MHDNDTFYGASRGRIYEGKNPNLIATALSSSNFTNAKKTRSSGCSKHELTGKVHVRREAVDKDMLVDGGLRPCKSTYVLPGHLEQRMCPGNQLPAFLLETAAAAVRCRQMAFKAYAPIVESIDELSQIVR